MTLSKLSLRNARRQAGDYLIYLVTVILSAALPAYSQTLFINIGIPAGIAPTLANIVNILMQVVISYPTMKFWVMPDQK